MRYLAYQAPIFLNNELLRIDFRFWGRQLTVCFFRVDDRSGFPAYHRRFVSVKGEGGPGVTAPNTSRIDKFPRHPARARTSRVMQGGNYFRLTAAGRTARLSAPSANEMQCGCLSGRGSGEWRKALTCTAHMTREQAGGRRFRPPTVRHETFEP